MSNDFNILDYDDVVSFTELIPFNVHRTLKITELRAGIIKSLGSNSQLFSDEGIDCEVLRQRNWGWKKGKIRMITAEFNPEIPEENKENNLNFLDNDDVVSFTEGIRFNVHRTLKISELKEGIVKDTRSQLFSDEGIDCEILRQQGGGWKKGKIRMGVTEFLPDLPEENQENSPLDDIRKTI